MMNKTVRRVVLLAGLSGLVGCSEGDRAGVTSRVTPLAPTALSAPAPQALADDEADARDAVPARMQRCQGELSVLQKVDAQRYAQRKVEFDRLMSGAAVYAGVRGEVQPQTQGAVDALYRFKTDKLCADIGQDVLTALARADSRGTP